MRASPGFSMVVAMLVAAPARAETAVPTHAGETGYLHVPVAESQGRGGAAFSLDLRYSQAADVSRTVAPSPLVMSFGLGRGEAGFSLRQGGLPGDARPYATIPAAAGKFSVLEAVGRRPALAVDLLLDHINRSPTLHLRAITTTPRHWRMRATAFGGGVIGIDRPSGWTAGAALSIAGPRQTEFVVEGLRQPGGLLAGAGMRWLPRPQFQIGLGTSYLPDDARTLLAGLSIAFLSPSAVRPSRTAEAEQAQENVTPKKGKRVFTSERPRFALEVRQRPVPGAEGGPAPHYPGNVAAVATSVEAAPAASPVTPEESAAKEAPPAAKKETATVEPPTVVKAAPEGKGDAGAEPAKVEPPIPGNTIARENRDAGTAAPDALADTRPEQTKASPATDQHRDAGTTTPDALPSAAPDASTNAVPDASPNAVPDASPSSQADASPGTAPPDAFAQPARVERLVPLPPTLKEGTGGEDQVRKAIASFQPALKECVDRALKRDPGLRGEARVELDIQSSGRVKLVAIHSKTLSGGWFEECVRRAATVWRMPRTAQGYRVEIPLKLHIANGGTP